MQDADTSAAADSGTSFDAAFSSQPAPAPTPEPAGGDDGHQPRDEHGRFAAKAQAEADAAAEAGKDAGDDREGGQIPSWRLREIREERDALKAERDRVAAEKAEYERELAVYRRQQRLQREAEQAPQRPDPIQDPDAYADFVESTIVGQRVQSVEQVIQDRFVNMTFEAQADVLGKDVFDPMVEAFIATAGVGGSRDGKLFRSVVEAPNPGAALVRWHKRHQAMTEVGDDLDGYNARLKAKLKSDPEFRKEFMAELEAEARGGNPASRSDTITALPSLNRAPGSAGGQRPGSLGETGEERFENAFGRRKRA